VAWYQSRGLGTEDLRDLDAAVEAARFACSVAAQTCARGRIDASAAGEEGP
jgi:hypothetical protein